MDTYADFPIREDLKKKILKWYDPGHKNNYHLGEAYSVEHSPIKKVDTRSAVAKWFGIAKTKKDQEDSNLNGERVGAMSALEADELEALKKSPWMMPPMVVPKRNKSENYVCSSGTLKLMNEYKEADGKQLNRNLLPNASRWNQWCDVSNNVNLLTRDQNKTGRIPGERVLKLEAPEHREVVFRKRYVPELTPRLKKRVPNPGSCRLDDDI